MGVMPLSTLKNLVSPLTTSEAASNLVRDVIWDRPVFRPPVFNPRIMFDPLPFTAQRMVPVRRQSATA